MKTTSWVIGGMLVAGLAASPAVGQNDPHAGHAMEKPAAAAAAPRNEALPPDADQAKGTLAKSPRHGEWVDVRLEGGGKLLTWVVFPEKKEKAGVVLVIHEIFGLTDWVRGVADQLAKEGFLAVAPDLLSGMGPNGGGTEALGDEVTKTIRNLTPEMVAARLNAVREYALKLPAASGKVGTVGFCWGGTSSFAYAVSQPKLNAAVVYYGTSPDDPAAYTKISAPVLGLYGGDDARVDATIPAAEAAMKKLEKRYTPMIFDGAGHGFLRQQTGRDGANMKASEKAWAATLAFLRENLK
ncbi:MAG: dienelactone hydrolase family protein [Thermoanaerobaculia bacterium]